MTELERADKKLSVKKVKRVSVAPAKVGITPRSTSAPGPTKPVLNALAAMGERIFTHLRGRDGTIVIEEPRPDNFHPAHQINVGGRAYELIRTKEVPGQLRLSYKDVEWFAWLNRPRELYVPKVRENRYARVKAALEESNESF